MPVNTYICSCFLAYHSMQNMKMLAVTRTTVLKPRWKLTANMKGSMCVQLHTALPMCQLFVGFKVFIGMFLRIHAFWDVTLCFRVRSPWHPEGSLYLHLQGQAVQDYPQDEGSTILQHDGNYSLTDMVPHSARLEFSTNYLFDEKHAVAVEETSVW